MFWYDHLTPEQEAQLAVFQHLLEEEGQLVKGLSDRLTLLRFLKARQWHAHRALKMYQVRAA